jgi:hypothetical protein
MFLYTFLVFSICVCDIFSERDAGRPSSDAWKENIICPIRIILGSRFSSYRRRITKRSLILELVFWYTCSHVMSSCLWKDAAFQNGAQLLWLCCGSHGLVHNTQCVQNKAFTSIRSVLRFQFFRRFDKHCSCHLQCEGNRSGSKTHYDWWSVSQSASPL